MVASEALVKKFPLLKYLFKKSCLHIAKQSVQFTPIRGEFLEYKIAINLQKILGLLVDPDYVAWKRCHAIIRITLFDYLFKNFSALEYNPKNYNALLAQLKFATKEYARKPYLWCGFEYNPFAVWLNEFRTHPHRPGYNRV